MSGFTKGPWSVGKKTGTLVFTGSDGGMGDFICEVCGEDDTPREVNKANARLIAAAPELYEALNGLLDDIESLMGESEGVSGLHRNGDIAPWTELDEGGRFERLSHLSMARAALSKAAGEGV